MVFWSIINWLLLVAAVKTFYDQSEAGAFVIICEKAPQKVTLIFAPPLNTSFGISHVKLSGNDHRQCFWARGSGRGAK